MALCPPPGTATEQRYSRTHDLVIASPTASSDNEREKVMKINYHIAEQSKLTSIHLFGFTLNDFTC